MSVASPTKSLAPSLRDEEHAVFDLPCRHPSSWTAPEWLMARQLGGSPHHHLRAFGYANTAVSNTRYLASKIAWNPSRMKNMIIAVGPGTPASRLVEAEPSEAESSDVDMESDDDDSDERGPSYDLIDNDGDGECESGESQDDDGDGIDEDEQEAEAIGPSRRAGFELRRRRILRRRLQRDDDDEDEDDESTGRNRQVLRSRNHLSNTPRSYQSSMRHGGCINTACWMTCPWRISTARETDRGILSSSFNVVASEEYPTQLITSGDDRLIKVWDVRDAMGSASPLPFGWDTFAPLSNSKIPTASIARSWNDFYNNRKSGNSSAAGSVRNIATMATGHRENVFHVTPVSQQPGKVLTCAADGYLRLCDLQAETSSVIVHPFIEDDDGGAFAFHGGMAFMHQLVSAHTGLLCSERGLNHFDLRVSPREQNRRCLLESVRRANAGWPTSSCKSCALWYPYGDPSEREEMETNYVFAGSSSAAVGLYDLRMDGSRTRMVERYSPRGLASNSHVSVSGLDVSRDGKELLVSYESDQIYSFPILHNARDAAGPSIEAIDRQCTVSSSDDVQELASYGGHLNRFTFLKNAKYAGPKDEYICTGSDSGHAWIYERKTGSVAAFLGADSCTCNGVIPHPSLPFFISYGIDTTAKLWRASLPVDPNLDDSLVGRAKASLDMTYEMSPVAKAWDGVQALVRHFDEDQPPIMPDFVASGEEIANSGRFSSPCRWGIEGMDSPKIGNVLRSLPMILRMNRFECYRAEQEGFETPVHQPLIEFSHRVSLMRLRYQADRLGLRWNPHIPWAFERNDNSDVDSAELVPDNPSDWILFDERMRSDDLLKPRQNFNTEKYELILRETFVDDPNLFEKDASARTPPWLNEASMRNDDESQFSWPLLERDEAVDTQGSYCRRALCATAALLKEAGNVALKNGNLHLAARRYDKAVQYCAVAFMRYYEGSESMKLLTRGHFVRWDLDGVSERHYIIAVWSPLLRILVSARLNLALLFLKPELKQARRACAQAKAAIQLLQPFATERRKVVLPLENGEVMAVNAPDVFVEAMTLQAKALFRLGTAQMDMEAYAAAIGSFESSLKITMEIDPKAKPDALVVRRLQEAKRKLKNKKKRDRRKFERVLSDPGRNREAVVAKVTGQGAPSGT